MSALYDDGHRRLQRRFAAERLADRLEQRLYRTALTIAAAADQAVIERLDLVFLAPADANCPRYIHEGSRFVPEAGRETPAPGWQQMDSARDAAPKGDPAGAM